MAGSVSLFQRERDDDPIRFVRGHGYRVFDEADRDYIDLVLGFGPVVLGHSDPEFNELLIQGIRDGLMMPGHSQVHYELVQWLTGQVGRASRGALFKTGSEAVTAATRLAALSTGRLGVIRCGYVGWHDHQLAQSPYWHEPLHSPLRSQIRFTDGFRGVSGSEAVLNWSSLDLAELDNLLNEAGGVAGCLVIDMYQLRYCSATLLAEAARLARNHGIAVILDETKTAGRAAAVAVSVDQGIEWDALILGKAMGNGAPVSVLVAVDDMAALASRTRIGGTFSKETFVGAS